MVYVDMSAPVEGEFAEGVYLCEVKKAEPATSGKGDNMFKVTLRGVDAPELEVKDTIMLGGRGWRMGRAKLTALGFDESYSGHIDEHDLVDRRAYLFLKNEDYTPKKGKNAGKTFTDLKPDPGQGTHSGYQPESNPPAGVVVPSASEPGDDLDDSTPF